MVYDLNEMVKWTASSFLLPELDDQSSCSQEQDPGNLDCELLWLTKVLWS